MAEGGVQFVDVGMEDAVDKADAGRLVGILIWELDVHFPQTAGKGCWVPSAAKSSARFGDELSSGPLKRT